MHTADYPEINIQNKTTASVYKLVYGHFKNLIWEYIPCEHNIGSNKSVKTKF